MQFRTASLLLIFLCGVVAGVRGGDTTNAAALKIIDDSQAAYAALSSYSDTGKVAGEFHGKTDMTTFTTRLARPNLYRIEWEGGLIAGLPVTSPPAVWSAGDGDFIRFGGGMGPAAQQMTNLEMALAAGGGISSGATAMIPLTFFNSFLGGNIKRLVSPDGTIFQLPDAQVGAVDCYVVTGAWQNKGRTNMTTLWVGKQDHLIRQFRRVSESPSITHIPADLDAAGREGFQRAMRQMQTRVSTETHENITVNGKFQKSDFLPEDALSK